MNILLVSPATPDSFWSFRHVLPFIARKVAFPPLGLLTVAAMLPREWHCRLVDLDATRLTDADLAWADYVFISAMIVHEESVRQVAARCREHGKPVVAGGPLFATAHARFPEIPHFVLGEAETLMPTLVADLGAGRVQPTYESPQRPTLTATPVPRWDLIRFDDYATMPVQFSRGCPFDCEFCDIVSLYGRVPRVKTPGQMIAEFDALVDAGWDRGVFIVDDNFIGHKPKVKAFLRELIAWQKRRGVNIPLLTEASVNLVDDIELLDLMVAAGFKRVFIGIETPHEESLVECAKVANTRRDLVAAVKTIQRAGIEVMAGFIVGFDSDTESIFERQMRFIQESGIVTAMVGLLTALPKTRLFERLQREGRMLRETTGNNLDAVLNFVPKLDPTVLVEGYRGLVKRLYAPKAYYRRALTFLREYRPSGPRLQRSRGDLRGFLNSLWIMGVCTRGRREFWKYLARTLLHHRQSFNEAMQLAIMGYHFRRIAASV